MYNTDYQKLLVCTIKWEPFIQSLRNVAALLLCHDYNLNRFYFGKFSLKMPDVFFQGQTLFWPYLSTGWPDWRETKRKCIGGYVISIGPFRSRNLASKIWKCIHICTLYIHISVAVHISRPLLEPITTCRCVFLSHTRPWVPVFKGVRKMCISNAGTHGHPTIWPISSN